MRKYKKSDNNRHNKKIRNRIPHKKTTKGTAHKNSAYFKKARTSKSNESRAPMNPNAETPVSAILNTVNSEMSVEITLKPQQHLHMLQKSRRIVRFLLSRWQQEKQKN